MGMHFVMAIQHHTLWERRSHLNSDGFPEIVLFEQWEWTEQTGWWWYEWVGKTEVKTHETDGRTLAIKTQGTGSQMTRNGVGLDRATQNPDWMHTNQPEGDWERWWSDWGEFFRTLRARAEYSGEKMVKWLENKKIKGRKWFRTNQGERK